MVRNLVLTGFMASGKSAVGRRVAERLAWPFVDLDEAIEAEAGRSVPEIFAAEGEEGFRDRESRALEKALRGGPAVIATGGGVLLREENRRLLAGHLLVNLRVTPEEAVARARKGGPVRPLLGGDDPTGRARAIFEARRALYDAVPIQVDTMGRSADRVADEVLERVARELRR